MDRKKRALRAAAVFLALFLGLLAVLLLRPACPILRLTGFSCAGCGGSRMFACLLRGEWGGALSQNPYLFFAVPLLTGYGVWEAVRYVRRERPLFRAAWAKLFLIVVVGAAVPFTVFRNL